MGKGEPPGAVRPSSKGDASGKKDGSRSSEARTEKGGGERPRDSSKTTPSTSRPTGKGEEARPAASSRTGQPSASTSSRTQEQRKADKELNNAQDDLKKADARYKEERQRSKDKATAANGGKTPAVVEPSAAEKQARTDREAAKQRLKEKEDAKKKADEAARRQAEADTATSSGRPPKTETATKTTAPADGGETEREKKAALKEEERKRKATSATTPATAGTSGKTAEQKAADERLRQAQKKAEEERKKRDAAKAGGDAKDLEKAEEDLKVAKDREKAAKAERDKAYGKTTAGPTKTDAQKKADEQLKKANEEYKAAREKEKAAQVAGDKAVEEKAKKERKAAGEKQQAAQDAWNKAYEKDTTTPTVRKAEKDLKDAKEAAAKAAGNQEEVKRARDGVRRAEENLKRARGGQGVDTSTNTWKWLIPLLLAVPLLGLLGSVGSARRQGHAPISLARSSRVAPSSRWVVNDAPKAAININNVNSQGGTASQGTIVKPAPIIETVVEATEPLTLHLSGPVDPDRLVWMVLAMGLAAAPLIKGWASDWPVMQATTTDYLGPLWQWLGAGVFMALALFWADAQFGFSRQYGGALAAVQVNPQILAAAVEGGENLFWGAEDLVFGNGRHLLGVVLAAGLIALVSQREPIQSAPDTVYAPMGVQLLYLGGSAVVGLLFWNA